ncbi:interferon-induced transmembrane protein 1-like [Equus quagga]|uniref:interferon-induced transmembrane protein 1-like n=1 Tax=Equus quagga TaxID=89248 RepID=UPI001EE2FCAC|nr:interferon-induced transmembrane protein 1-like [Equus quagga]XP_046506328.1 interferon-induced transmembrane protein 1-like [Equus quagga]XP_046506329.1 interferon-induced transmembrane protein 1-like [Equus quagga]XP_046506330.1 interferon-induced transmembrane protein 1-like [Equus quagga]
MSGDEKGVVVMGAPQGSAPMTTTVINIHSEPPIRDHVIWSLFNTLFMNWCCLGFVAFAFSVKMGGCSRDWKMVGDMTGARSYASTARSLNVAALVLGVAVTIVFIGIFAASASVIYYQISGHPDGDI